jgi:hypothetical protein
MSEEPKTNTALLAYTICGARFRSVIFAHDAVGAGLAVKHEGPNVTWDWDLAALQKLSQEELQVWYERALKQR